MQQQAELAKRVLDNIGKVILGSSEGVQFTVLAFLAGGHILMEDSPGVGKTTLAKSLARSVDASFKRIQFTPDLLPADVTGTSIYSPKSQAFNFREGPVFCNILLADEINRASPRTQSALLEAMNEAQVSVDGETYALPDPFLVVATQNPIEQHGTYPLPEAQLDRFAVKVSIGYPEASVEADILEKQALGHPLEKLASVVSLEEVNAARDKVRHIKVERSVTDYMVAITRATREHTSLRLGVSPRGSLILYRIAQAHAFIEDRDYVTPDDVKKVATPVLAHRLVLESKARYSGVTGEDVVHEILNEVKAPV